MHENVGFLESLSWVGRDPMGRKSLTATTPTKPAFYTGVPRLEVREQAV